MKIYGSILGVEYFFSTLHTHKYTNLVWISDEIYGNFFL